MAILKRCVIISSDDNYENWLQYNKKKIERICNWIGEGLQGEIGWTKQIYDILEKYGKYFDKEIIEIFEQKKEAKLNKF